MNTINQKNVLNELFKITPSLKKEYIEDFKNWDEFPGFHNIFGMVFNPYLINLLENEDQNENKLNEIFDFLERMANCGDEDLENVLSVTILERLGGDSEILNKSYKYMLPKTREASDDIEDFWVEVALHKKNLKKEECE